MARRQKTATWLSRCVLAVALLFGIVLMHALAHPGEHTAPSPAGGHASAASHAPAASTAQVAVAESHHATHPTPAHGVGAAAVCLAVLAVGVGVLLLARGALRRMPVGDVLPAIGRLAHALRAIPPPGPPGSLLTRLSLLRI
ncbi:DUF6153 family protein [Streptomyces sp. MUM 178J]|uniref:DUF6153 family protein n=1 Tax=Streptomyces sp. MUM 178J TaxID=2791991 RepID=UPI001F034D99|nr:DUF6153 family protein [Streptomyces sp. MUM 178J]WRQ78260.1 DUF6153 family protein [Streptomyces sp. MUM 178J]